jgi:Nif-specific regulatory protein
MGSPAAHLLITDPVVGRRIARLTDGERLTLGRAPTNHVVLHDERASRFHAEIIPVADAWTIRDLASRNGTLIGELPLQSDHQLVPGDTILIGRTELVFQLGDPPTDSATGSTGTGATAAGEVDPEVDRWQGAIRHRRARSRLLEEIRETSEVVPRVGRAAAELCRLAFALGRTRDGQSISRQALESAMQGVHAARGIVLLAHGIAAGTEPAARILPENLEQAAALPEAWPQELIPAGLIATVLGTDEALLASPAGPGQRPVVACVSAPIRAGGRAVGVMHLETGADSSEASPDDLEFVMAVCDALGVAIENLSAREMLSTRLASTADENERLKRRLREEGRMVGTSPALATIREQIGRVAATKATVLVRGESGSGKELVAREIHEASDRRSGPFVCLNCAALSETLLESELFGHEKGAFTGATERKAGKFETAHKGTLMLDEIGEMSPAIQAKFLRVLEGHPFERVGGSNRVQVDVRVVAATNRNLEQAVTAGEFRRDLYFRLKVVEIVVPPLRKRPEDVEALAVHFLERFAAETGRQVREFTPEAMHALKAYHWPGNIRELRNAIERAVVLSLDESVDAHEFALSHLAPPGDTDQGAHEPAGFVPETLDAMERRQVMKTLEAVGGNKTKAAAILGIERSTLDRKLARWASH